ncbi:hypothetical protein FJ942_26360 [Mesorhizobium sp. B2-4-2]|uniref:hypothetical protein n=1 Tax=Mesorhizobium sp. B2-4-2 TaxID=2589947 RepID=UPI00112EEAF8|nr:hypothetical protein [Mesorhizobium sp. B2-4-2]TPL47997.1 hypothetical protein FJ942_26360 [Mesorhizobium sp. B2-4-2]
MKVGYTEFSFGYAFTENLIRSSPIAPVGAPVFPNLIQEGSWGFDIRINFPATPLFLQYKLPELMRRGTAFEIANWNCPGLRVPFFRIAVMRRDISRQHELLIELESRYPANVFYAAPTLENVRAFDSAYNAAAVARRSVFFSPTEIGPLPDDKIHTIAYRRGLATGYFCSKPKPIKALSFDQLSTTLSAKFEEKRFGELQFAAREVRENILDLVSPAMRDAHELVAERVRARRRPTADGTPRSPEEELANVDIAVAREIARVDMGIDLLIAQPR